MSPVSKFLRILRIERNENAKAMADKLDISPSYLSAIENGKRTIPSHFQEKIIRIYELSEEKQAAFKKAVEESSTAIKLNFPPPQGASERSEKIKQIVFVLAKNELSDELVDDVHRLLCAR